MSASNKNFHLPWHQHDQYWIGVRKKSGELPAALVQPLNDIGLRLAGNIIGIKTGRDWKKSWEAIYKLILPMQHDMEVTVIHGVGALPADTKHLDWRTPPAMQHVADSMWLGDALMEDKILCYLQPVVSSREKVFGYESFARAEGADGKIIGGDKIMAASRALGIEFMIDRHLHVQAITTFVCSDFDGFLFVNLFPGFIHRPEVYLGGLSEAAKNFGMVSKHVVLDFTRVESTRDVSQLKKICEYGRSKGYSIALDDIETLEGAKRLIADIKPDFIKVDNKLAKQAKDKQELLVSMVEHAHASGVMVIAEGVETEDMYEVLKKMGVDLFQGYHFSPPVPVETVMKAGKAAI